PTVIIGGNTAAVKTAVAGSPDVVTILTPARAPGPANPQMSTNRGTGVRVGGFTYEADARTPFVPEADTRLLWHLDETTDGGVRIADYSGLSIDATGGGPSKAQPGLFACGRQKAYITADSDDGLLYFGSSSYTLECWMKTDPVTNAYTLVGKNNIDGYYLYTEYAIRLMPSGLLRVLMEDGNRT